MPNGVVMYEVVADLLAKYSGKAFLVVCLIVLLVLAYRQGGLRRR